MNLLTGGMRLVEQLSRMIGIGPLLLVLFFPALVGAQTIDEIRVDGNRKIEADAILSRIRTIEGQDIDKQMVREDIQSIFSMGYFYDVQVESKLSAGKTVLIYRVVERPSIAQIVFKGNDEIDDEELTETVEINTFEIVDMDKIQQAVVKMQKLYEDKGFFLARIESRLEDVNPGETVRLVFDVRESDKVEVKRITFLGNRNFSDQKLKGALITQEGGFFSFLSGSGQYKQEAFDRDVNVIRLLYFNEGYVQVKVDRPEVYVTPDKRSIYITMRVEEGDQFNVGEVDFSGDLLFPDKDLRDSVLIDDSDVFSYQKLQNDLSILQAKYGDLGYAYANIIPKTRMNEADRLVDITFELDKGEKVYFGKINVVGNTKTRDKVVRRELEIFEGELYNETRRRESVANVQRLGFFEEVNFKTSTPPDRPNLMDIDIVVKERNTGSIQLGAGYGSTQGFTLQGQVNQTNFLGRGQRLSASLQHSDVQSLFNFNFTEPYFNDTEWSIGVDLYRSKRRRDIYDSERGGGAVRVGHPLAKYLQGFVRYRLDDRNLSFASEEDADPVVFPLETSEGTTSSVMLSLEFDKRDDRFAPTKGTFARASVEYAGLGGDLKYTLGNFTYRYFKKVFWEVVFRSNWTYGILLSHDGDAENVPFDERFLLGGPYSLRGYRYGTVGARRFSEKQYDDLSNISDEETRNELATRFIGGTQQALVQLELEFPLVREAGIKGVVFYDAGQAEDELVDYMIFSDFGFGFRWFSPIGPLRFEWGFPNKRIKGWHDSPVNFEFSIGSPF